MDLGTDWLRLQGTATQAESGVQSGLRDLWLARLWPLSILFHLAGNGLHLEAMDTIGLVQLGLVAAAVAQAVRPSTTSTLALAGGFVAVLWMKLPVVGNHEIILGLLCLAILFSTVCSGARWPRTVGPTARWILLIAYGFIAVSKLNRGFFDVVNSCAVVFADEFGANTGLASIGADRFGALVIAATAAVELAIPVLLLSRRLRSFGVVVALGFHFVLALDPVSHVWDFSATLLPLFLLFAPPGFRHGLDRMVDGFARRRWTERMLLFGLALAGHAVIAFGGIGPVWLVAYPLWLGLGGLLLWQALVFLRAHPLATDDWRPFSSLLGGHRPGSGIGRSLVTVGLASVVLLAVANGSAPYLELRSAAAFNMYSNLRVVDGTSNHFLIGSARSQAMSDYVAVVETGPGSPLAFYRDAGLLVPRENLDRYLAQNTSENPVISFGATTAAARDVGLGAERSGGLGDRLAAVVGHKLGFRRAVPGTTPVEAGGTGFEQAVGDECLRRWGPIG